MEKKTCLHVRTISRLNFNIDNFFYEMRVYINFKYKKENQFLINYKNN